MTVALRKTNEKDAYIMKSLEKMALKSKRSKSAVVTEIISDYLENVELAEKGEKAYKEFLDSDRKTYTLDELKQAVL